jgi:serine/threonine protein kinase
MAVSLDQFLAQVSNAGLLSPERAAALIERANADPRLTVETIARELVDQGRLTEYQTRQFLTGKGRGLVLGNYVILERLGQGGMGTVYKARHRRMDRLVALKVLKPDIVKTPELLARFQREVKAAARLEHPNIVAAYDADEARGTHFFVMQYIDGHDLATLLKQQGPLPLEQALRCVIQAAEGLRYAHHNGVIHRDIKPGNMLLDRKGVLKLLDMGLARIEGESSNDHDLTTTGAVMGTVDFMAPEQAMSTKDADARSDIYSLGVTLWQLLVGRAMYAGDSLMARLIAHREAPIPSLTAALSAAVGPLDLTRVAPLEAVVRRMVAKRPADRYQSIDEVLEALNPILAGDSVTSPSLNARRGDQTRAEFVQSQPAPSPATATPTVGMLVGSDDPQPTTPSGLLDQPTHRTLPHISSTPTGMRRRRWWLDRRIVGGATAVVVLSVLLPLMMSRDSLVAPLTEQAVVNNSNVSEFPPAESLTESTAGSETGEAAPPVSLAEFPRLGSWPFDPEGSRPYVWSPPEFVNGSFEDSGVVLFLGVSADERTLYHKAPHDALFYRTDRSDPLADFVGKSPAIESGQVPIFDGAVSQNGLALAAVAKNGNGVEQIWLAVRAATDQPFGKLQLAPEPVNVPGVLSRQPVFTPDGLTLLVTSPRLEGRSGDIWPFRRAGLELPFQADPPLSAPVNGPAWDMAYYLSDDRQFLIASTQSRDRSGQNVRRFHYLTRANPQGPFTTDDPLELPLGAAQTLPSNQGFELAADGRALYFTSSYPQPDVGKVRLLVCRRVQTPETRWPFDPEDGRLYTWSPPEILLSSVRDQGTKYLMGIGGDERTIYYNILGSSSIFRAERPRPDAEFAPPISAHEQTLFSIWEGFVSANGLAAAVVSNHGQGVDQIWLAHRPATDQPFGAFQLAPAPINLPGIVSKFPCFTPDGLTLLFTSTRAGTVGGDIWRFTRSSLDSPFQLESRLAEPANGAAWDMAFYLSQDQRFLITGAQHRDETSGAEVRTIRYFTRTDSSLPFESARPLDLPLGFAKTWDNNQGFQLAADGRAVYFASGYPDADKRVVHLQVCRRVPVAESHTANTAVDPPDTASTAGERDAQIARFARSWSLPESLGADVNTEFWDEYPFVLRDEKTLWYSGGGRLRTASRPRLEAAFEPGPELPGPVNAAPFWDSEPRLSSDELTLYFSSERGNQPPQTDIWMATRADPTQSFGQPVKLPDGINTPWVEVAPTVTPDGLTLYFASDRPTEQGRRQLYQATRATTAEPFGNVTILPPEINLGEQVTAPSVSADGLLLLFAALPPNTVAHRSLDLHYAARTNPAEPFGAARRFANAINSPYEENGPFLSHDGQTLYFYSDRPGTGGKADLFQARRLTPTRASP